jgi:phosphoglycerate dehydrogenase-like enzyme
MKTLTVWVLGKGDDPHLARLREKASDVTLVVGDGASAFDASSPPDAILNWRGRRGLLEEVWEKGSRPRWIHVPSAGLDHVLSPALAASDTTLTHAHGVFGGILAEFTMAAVLFFAKDLRRMIRSQEAGSWDPFDVVELKGQTMGIVGYGDIGAAVAERARPFGMRILALRRRPEVSRNDPLVDEVLPPSGLRDLMARSDCAVLVAPLTRETRGMVGEAELAALRRTAVLVNIGRGAVVDEPALVRALEERRIRGAALDVFETEPLPEGHPFYRLDNVLLSPHCADHTPGWRDTLVDLFLENLERFRRGQPLAHVVTDKTRGY